jgi:hypothetical protein
MTTSSSEPIASGASSPAPPDAVLIDFLHQAAQLEHCLLDSYLFAACSLKTLPDEFAFLPDGRENRRRAIQFERVRAWKQATLEVAHEEMLHLHYVECLIRALDTEPYLGLPPRDPDSGNWFFGNWTAHAGSVPSGRGTEVPVLPVTPANVRRFVLYESTDALQDQDPFGAAAMDLYERLHTFELDFLLETLLYEVADEKERAELMATLRDLYLNLRPAEGVAPKVAALAVPATTAADINFQSIADLYNDRILPLYQDAFMNGRVGQNLQLVGELRDPNYAGEGFLPILPVFRDKNFDKAAKEGVKQPLYTLKSVDGIIAQIVEQGEGQQGFVEGAEALLAKVAELSGPRAYVKALLDDASSPDPTPDWLDECQRIRLSHLYRFAMTMIDLEHERTLAHSVGAEFHPSRTPIASGLHRHIEALAAELPAQFNATYLALVMWLSRIYEVKNWESDRRRRMGIEMLASWPMMSIAIRPFLELASFLPIDPRELFRLERDKLPADPPAAQELFDLYSAPERTQAIDDQMDQQALTALSAVAGWASRCRATIHEVKGIDPHVLRAISARLDSLSTLDEFERQFPYRQHGGYSNRKPDQTFLFTQHDEDRYEENATYSADATDPAHKQLFANTFVLRVRFAGRELVQLSTDPDPPTDEAGCTGTHMLHAADGDDHWFDRALVWQPDLHESPNIIVREPRSELPPLGIAVCGLDLNVTGDAGATSGYFPIGLMSSTGAVQTQGVQQIARVSGLHHVDRLASEGLRIALLPKNGVMPYLNGYNHLVWQDGEPIDPFVLALLDTDGDVVWQREIYNEGKRLMDMSPLQRLLAMRGVCGFDSYTKTPDWARAALSPQEREQLAKAEFPGSYLDTRASVLAEALKQSLNAPVWDRAAVDTAISFADRLRLVASPRGTTVDWLKYICHYGHTISGDQLGPGQPALPGKTATGLQLTLARPDRKTPNGRWLVTYAQGVMDTDALSAMIFGELYVPLEVTTAGEQVTFTRSWRFPAGVEPAVSSYALQFAAPFWAQFKVESKNRSITLADGTVITETLTSSTDSSYTYSATGVPGISSYAGTFAAEPDPEGIALSWTTTFIPADAAASVRMFSIDAGAADAMTQALDSYFAPR